jgi:hypothetical protein
MAWLVATEGLQYQYMTWRPEQSTGKYTEGKRKEIKAALSTGLSVPSVDLGETSIPQKGLS